MHQLEMPQRLLVPERVEWSSDSEPGRLVWIVCAVLASELPQAVMY